MTQKQPKKRYAVRVTAGETTYLLPDPYAQSNVPLLLTRKDALSLANKYPRACIYSNDDKEPLTCIVEEFHT